jgi:hypothetical protein
MSLWKYEFVENLQILEVHMFTTDQLTGIVQVSSEMRPQ